MTMGRMLKITHSQPCHFKTESLPITAPNRRTPSHPPMINLLKTAMATLEMGSSLMGSFQVLKQASYPDRQSSTIIEACALWWCTSPEWVVLVWSMKVLLETPSRKCSHWMGVAAKPLILLDLKGNLISYNRPWAHARIIAFSSKQQ